MNDLLRINGLRRVRETMECTRELTHARTHGRVRLTEARHNPND